MATLTAQDPGLSRGKAYVGLQHYALPYTALDTETITPGISGMVHVAFEPDEVADVVTVALTDESTINAVAVGGGSHSGIIHVWARS